MGSKREELLPEVFFDLPEVGRLPSEGSAMDLAKSWEPFAVVAAEEEIDSFVGVYAEKLSDDLYGEDLSVGELRSGTALADAAPSLSRSSMRQKTATMKVLRSIRRRPPLRLWC